MQALSNNKSPDIIEYNENIGIHNANLQYSCSKLIEGKSYQDLSTICLIPTRGMIHARVIQSWFSLMSPMNQKFVRIFLTGMDVADAYNFGIETIMNHPELSKWKYILTMEDDNLPPPDGLLNLYKSIDKFDVVGGLYWTKGEDGRPMIYGDPKSEAVDFIPQLPIENTLQQCNGLGMGFNLFKLDIFRDSKITKPWFKTLQEVDPKRGIVGYTQDLYFFDNAGKLGYKFACDTRIKVGHFDAQSGIVW